LAGIPWEWWRIEWLDFGLAESEGGVFQKETNAKAIAHLLRLKLLIGQNSSIKYFRHRADIS
jgi:hypothetical protein